MGPKQNKVCHIAFMSRHTGNRYMVSAGVVQGSFGPGSAVDENACGLRLGEGLRDLSM